MDFNLKGKVAVITGAGGAICGEIAKAFASEGARVAIWDLSLDAATKRRDERDQRDAEAGVAAAARASGR